MTQQASAQYPGIKPVAGNVPVGTHIRIASQVVSRTQPVRFQGCYRWDSERQAICFLVETGGHILPCFITEAALANGFSAPADQLYEVTFLQHVDAIMAAVRDTLANRDSESSEDLVLSGVAS